MVDLARGAGRLRAREPKALGRRRRSRPVRRGACSRRRRRARRASPAGHERREARGSQASVPRRREPHRRKLERDQRRRRCARRRQRGEGRAARFPTARPVRRQRRRRRRSTGHGHRAGARGAQAARAGRPRRERPRSRRAQRGVCLSEPPGHPRAGPRPGARERQRGRDRHRPPARDERRAARRQLAPRATAAGGALRARDALRRGRPGSGGHLRSQIVARALHQPVRHERDHERVHGMEGAHLVDVDVDEDALEDGEAEQEERGRRKDESEHPVGLDRGAAENVEADKEELHDDAEEEEDRQAVEEHSRLRHAGSLPPMAVVTQREFGLFIDGETVEPASGEVRELTEPATGAPLAKAAMAGEADVDRAVEAARAALEGPWGKTPPNERSRLLHALADAIVANRKELTELETRNVGKAVSSVKGEVAVSAENFRWYASAIASIAGRTTPIGGSILAYTLKEPVGVAAQIVPWNYPIMMAAWKLAPALAA